MNVPKSIAAARRVLAARPRMGRRLLAGLTASIVCWLAPAPALAKTHNVKTTKELADVATYLAPGDLVLIAPGQYQGGLRFWKSGTEDKPIIVRGIKDDQGKRPIFSGSRDTFEVGGHHYVFESIELTGGEFRCFFAVGHDLTLHDMVIRDCPKHGLLSADDDSGSLTVQYSEFYGSGEGGRHHQVYVTADQRHHPNAVFRFQHNYVHDATGGNNIKSRAARNEIYFNWIEGAKYHELELIGPDGGEPDLLREDSDIVGNVLWKTNDGFATRIGGDGTMDTNGRYRFVNNTIIVPAEHRAPFRFFDGLESVEMHNNVIHVLGGGPVVMVRDDRVKWTRGKALISGTNNFIPPGSTMVPDSWTGTIEGKDPKFINLAGFDLRPAEGSPLIDAGSTKQPSPPDAAFPNPRTAVDAHPKRRMGQLVPRKTVGAIDIGAFESGAAEPPTTPPAPVTSGTPRTAPSAPVQPVSPKVPPPKTSRCSCDVVGHDAAPPWWLLGLGFAFARRRRPENRSDPR